MEYPKVLIICHNLYDVTNNIGKTLVSLMDGYPKEKIAQLYFRNDSPSFHYCSNYYCITDKSVLKSILSFGLKKAGNVVEKKDDLTISDAENNFYKIGNHRHPAVSLIRDTLWSIPVWKTKSLKQWLHDFDPDVILFAPNDYTLAYRISLYVQKEVNKTIIPFYMDDAFYWNCETSLIDNYRRKRIRCFARRIHQHSRQILTICNYMSEEYEKIFALPCQAFVNSVHVGNIEEKKKLNTPVVFSYLGNLHSNRWKGLFEIGEALRKIEEDKGIKCSLDVYSASLLEDRMIEAFEAINNIRFKGAVPASKVREIQVSSDVLVHVESFDVRSANSTRLSLSTKIPEYMSSGVPIFAYGPEQIASMKYLRDYNLAQTCFFKDKLYESLLSILTDNSLRIRYVNNSVLRVMEEHDIQKVSKDFQRIFSSI